MRGDSSALCHHSPVVVCVQCIQVVVDLHVSHSYHRMLGVIGAVILCVGMGTPACLQCFDAVGLAAGMASGL